MSDYPKDMTSALRDVLSFLNFRTGPIANVLRDGGGWDIPCRCEDEQAVVLHWLIGLALEHGEGWQKIAGETIDACIPKAKEAREARDARDFDAALDSLCERWSETNA